MRILSDSVINQADLKAIDEKQTRNIKQLRIAVAVVFLVNLAISIALHFM